MNKITRIVFILLLFLILILIRAFEQFLFYDPLLDYFKNEYVAASLPVLNMPKYFLHIFWRFLLNTIVSLGIIYLFFQNRRTLVFSIIFYCFSFIILSLFLFILLKFEVFDSTIFIFYVRRFLIQPLFVFVLLLAFYYQTLQGKKS